MFKIWQYNPVVVQQARSRLSEKVEDGLPFVASAPVDLRPRPGGFTEGFLFLLLQLTVAEGQNEGREGGRQTKDREKENE